MGFSLLWLYIERDICILRVESYVLKRLILPIVCIYGLYSIPFLLIFVLTRLKLVGSQNTNEYCVFSKMKLMVARIINFPITINSYIHYISDELFIITKCDRIILVIQNKGLTLWFMSIGIVFLAVNNNILWNMVKLSMFSPNIVCIRERFVEEASTICLTLFRGEVYITSIYMSGRI